MYYLCFLTTVIKERPGICVISGEKVFNLTDFVHCMFSGKLFQCTCQWEKMVACKSQFYVLVPVVGVVIVDGTHKVPLKRFSRNTFQTFMHSK